MHKIFISYSRADYDKVMILKKEIEHLIGVGSCWVDLTGIESDQQFVDVIIDAIDKSDIFLFMYSQNSDRSEWTRKEINYAHSEKKRIVFVKMENIQLSKYFRFQFGEHDIIDLQDKKQKEKLLNNLLQWNMQEQVVEQQDHEKKEPKEIQGVVPLYCFISKFPKLSLVEILILGSVVISIINFIIGLPLFLGVNYRFRDYLRKKYPRYWKVISNKKLYVYSLLVINIIVSFFLFCFSCQEYDSSFLFSECVLFIISILFGYFCLYSSFSLNFKKQKNGVVLFGIPVLFYFCSVLLSLYNMFESHVVIPNVVEVQDSVAMPEVQIETDEENADSVYDYNVNESEQVRNPNTEYRLRGSFGQKVSELRITEATGSGKIFGYIEHSEFQEKISLHMWLNKRSLEGTVENQDGKNIGYVDCICEVKDSLLTIKGKITLLVSEETYNYVENKVTYTGEVPAPLLTELQRQ